MENYYETCRHGVKLYRGVSDCPMCASNLIEHQRARIAELEAAILRTSSVDAAQTTER